MARKPKNQPTDAELTILNVLWESGPATVRDIHSKMVGGEAVGYTTVLKTLQIMADKGLVVRDESQRAHVYSAADSESDTQRSLLGDLVDRAFQGSAGKLVMQALSSKKTTKAEIEEIRRMLDEAYGDEDQ